MKYAYIATAALSLTAVAVTCQQATAAEAFYNFARLARVTGAEVVGPAHVYFIGLNPFTPQGWQAAENSIVVSGADLPFQTPGSSNAPAQSGTAAKANTIAANTANSHFAQSGQISVDSPQAANDTCASPKGPELAACAAQTMKEYADLLIEVRRDDMCRMQAIRHQNMIIGAVDAAFASEVVRSSTQLANLLGTINKKFIITGTSLPLCDPNAMIDPDALRGPSLGDEIRALPAWPTARIATVSSHIVALQKDLTAISPGEYKHRLAGETAGQTSSEAVQKERKAMLDADAKAIATDKKLFDIEAATIATLLPNGSNERTFQPSYDQLQSLRKRLGSLSLGSFYYEGSEPCRGLGNSGKRKTFTVTVEGDLVSDVTTVCDPRLVVSSGVLFSRLEQKTYGSVPTNSALPTPPAGQPTPPPAQVVQQTFSAVRPLSMALANVQIFPDTDRGAFWNNVYASFGFSINSTQTTSAVDYAGGLSYSIDRLLFVTAGLHLGNVDQPAPGYDVGSPIAAGTTPQTLTRRRTAPFLGISFSLGASPNTPSNGTVTTPAKASTDTGTQGTGAAAAVQPAASPKP